MRAKDLKVGDVFAHGNKLVVEVSRGRSAGSRRKMYIHYKYRAEDAFGREIWYKQVLSTVVDANKEMGPSEKRVWTGRSWGHPKKAAGKKRSSGPTRYPTTKSPSDPTYSAQWSGVTGAPQARGKKCSRCGGAVHREGESFYCPSCDDYVSPVSGGKKRHATTKDERLLAGMRGLGVRWPKGHALPTYPSRMTAEQKRKADKLYDAMSEQFIDKLASDVRKLLK